ncbi:MAG: GNAT family N-acetyltransferase [Verrucomicrobiales bacterium]
MDSQLSEYRAEDLRPLADLYRASILALGRDFYTEEQLKACASLADDLPAFEAGLNQGHTWVIRCQGQAIAFGQLQPSDHLTLLHCHPAYVKCGHSKTLCQHLEAIAVRSGQVLINTDSSRVARSFFEAQGFVCLKSEVVLRHGVAIERFKMAKLLQPYKKWAILGNSGSGKSTLAKRIALCLNAKVLDLDTIAWDAGPERRDLSASHQAIRDWQDGQTEWVIEGCYEDLLQVVNEPDTALLWLDPPTAVCQNRVSTRRFEPHKYSSMTEQQAALPELTDWIARYSDPQRSMSWHHHNDLYQAWAGPKFPSSQETPHPAEPRT